MNIITQSTLTAFGLSLYDGEKSRATVAKYMSSIERLSAFLDGRRITKELLLEYRDELLKKYKVQTVNGNISAINAYIDFCGQSGMKLKLLRVQRQVFLEEEKELSEEEYRRLLRAALCRGNERLYLLLLTLGSTGIRISELCYMTVEAVMTGRAQIQLKGKNRTVILQKELRKRLRLYAQKCGIESGHIFRTRSGKPLDRSNICHDMKKLCPQARVDECKVFPHNLRHLFARVYYKIEKNLAHLADVLGHSRIETTRIYVAVSASSHERILNRMRMII